MQCAKCNADNPAGMRFCGQCATPLLLLCSSCGASNAADSRFCGHCATPLSRPAASQFTSPDRYTPKHIAEKILISKAALEGERKQVTVLFADLKGSMELLADRDPEEARKLLDPVLERMMEAVHRYEGTVNQVMGDGIMALFGAPVAHEDHAVRACYAALRMQESVKRYADEVLRREGALPQIRVGLNSGEVVVRSIGSDLRMDYTAVGQTTHLAARMEQLAVPGTTLLTIATLRLVEGFVQITPRGPVPVRGIADPIEVFELSGATRARRSFEAAAARGLSRFVGRQTELAILARALEQAKAGRGQIVAPVGEPGVGKSRLFWEFTHSHRMQSCLVLESGSVSYGRATSYLPVIDLFKGYFRIEDRDEHRQIREKVIGKLLALDPLLERTVPAFLALLDVPVEDSGWHALDPSERRQRTLDAAKRLLLRESHVQPLVLVIEDLHWIDGETQALLESLVDSLPTARLLLLVNYRPEYQHSWGSKTYYRQLQVDPLPPESAEELLDALLGDGADLKPFKRLLIERTEGNPFFIEESIRTLVETQALVGERGAYHLTRDVAMLQVTPTVQAVLASRIDRLPPNEKSLLQMAAVIGKDVAYSLLEAIADVPEAALRHALGHLQAAEFLYETRLFPDLEYTFKHALTHEVAYSSLLGDRRRTLHARIVDAIEQLYPSRLAEHVERLAHHALRGEVWEKAFMYLRQAGVKVEARAANREAVEYFERSLSALRQLPETRHSLEQAIELRFDLRRPLFQLGETDKMLGYLREAATIAETLGDRLRQGWALAQLGGHAWIRGNQREALDLSQRAHEIAAAARDVPLQVHASLRVAWAHHTLGDYRRAVDFLLESIAPLEGDRALERFGHVGLPAVWSRTQLAWSLAERGEFEEGVVHGEEAVRIAIAVGHQFSRVVSGLGLGVLRLMRGEFEAAIAILEPCHQLSETVSVAAGSLYITPFLGLTYVRAGRPEKGLPLLQAAIEFTGSRKLLLYQAARAVALGEAYLDGGRVAEALDYCERALDLARRHHERGHEAYALRLRGEIAAAHPEPVEVESAETYYREALAIATELGMRPLIGHCHLGLGRLYSRVAQLKQAHEHLMTATAMYRRMGMRFWLEQAEVEMKGVA